MKTYAADVLDDLKLALKYNKKGIAKTGLLGLGGVATAATGVYLTPQIAAAQQFAKPKATVVEQYEPIEYEVKKGDWLSKIAYRFGFHDWRKLYEDNKGTVGNNPNLIYPGQILIVDHKPLKSRQELKKEVDALAEEISQTKSEINVYSKQLDRVSSETSQMNKKIKEAKNEIKNLEKNLKFKKTQKTIPKQKVVQFEVTSEGFYGKNGHDGRAEASIIFNPTKNYKKFGIGLTGRDGTGYFGPEEFGAVLRKGVYKNLYASAEFGAGSKTGFEKKLTADYVYATPGIGFDNNKLRIFANGQIRSSLAPGLLRGNISYNIGKGFDVFGHTIVDPKNKVSETSVGFDKKLGPLKIGVGFAPSTRDSYNKKVKNSIFFRAHVQKSF